MPRRATKRGAPDPLAQLRARVREAERKFVPIGRVPVAIDAEGGTLLEELVARGAGKMNPVLQQALKIGLQVMHDGHAAVEDEPTQTTRGTTIDYRFSDPTEHLNGGVAPPPPWLDTRDPIPPQPAFRPFGSGVVGGPAAIATAAVPSARPASEAVAEEYGAGGDGE
jgi:hypothetical protein